MRRESRRVVDDLFQAFTKDAWKSRSYHPDDVHRIPNGCFIVGLPTTEGMISCHYDMTRWNEFDVPEIRHAPLWDGAPVWCSAPSDDDIREIVINSGEN